MNQAEFEKQLDTLIEKQYRALGVDPDDPRGIQATQEQRDLVVERYAAEIEARKKSDPEFEAAYRYHLAAQEIKVWETDNRPKGEYGPDYIIPVEERWGRLVLMRFVTREHLLSWALLEDDERNLAYIKSRLDLWDDHPECKTLAELEKAES